jgi:hypothetical protein
MKAIAFGRLLFLLVSAVVGVTFSADALAKPYAPARPVALKPVPAAGVAGAPPATPMPSPGVTWQTSMVQGLTRYLEQRAGQELTLWLEEEFVYSLCKAKFHIKGQEVIGSALFPQTCELAHDDTTHLGSTFAAALRADLEQLPVSLASYALGVDAVIPESLFEVLLGLREGKPPLELIAGLSQNPKLNALCPSPAAAPANVNAACSLVALGYVASFCQDIETNPSVNLDTLASSLVPLATANPGLGFKATLTAAEVKPFLSELQAIYVLVRAWHDAPATTAGERAARGGILMGRILDAVNRGLPMLDSPKFPFFFPQGASSWTKIEGVFRASSTLLQGDVGTGVQQGLHAVLALGTPLPKSVVRVVTVAADLAGATTPDQVQSALQSSLAPLGSWRGKHRAHMIALNAFVGVTGGYEYPLTKLGNGDKPLDGNGSFAAFAPVGLDFTLATGPCALGAFVSVLDVGQLLSTPVAPTSNDEPEGKTAEAGGDVKIAQVLSPGMYLHGSIGNSPITFGVGAALAPSLRTYRAETGETSAYSMLRAGAFLAVDLTLLPITRSAESE